MMQYNQTCESPAHIKLLFFNCHQYILQHPISWTPVLIHRYILQDLISWTPVLIHCYILEHPISWTVISMKIFFIAQSTLITSPLDFPSPGARDRTFAPLPRASRSVFSSAYEARLVGKSTSPSNLVVIDKANKTIYKYQ